MKVNYYLVKSEVHGRLVEESASSDLSGLKGKFHSTILSSKSILEHPKKDTLYEILDLKHRLLDLIKILQADREVINNIWLSNQDIFKTEEISPELDDHIRHLLDETDVIRDLLTNLSDLYYNSDSANLNKTTKRFTIYNIPYIITIFNCRNFWNE